jgi:hypothetical protein
MVQYSPESLRHHKFQVSKQHGWFLMKEGRLGWTTFCDGKSHQTKGKFTLGIESKIAEPNLLSFLHLCSPLPGIHRL